MLIHRIAHPLVVCPDAGRAVGPYNAASTASRIGRDDLYNLLNEVADFLCMRLDSSHTPPPVAEGHYIRAGREQSVFLNEAQAAGWFRDGVEQMQAAGFRWFTYEVQERYVRVTRVQAMADLRRARLLSIADIPFQSDADYFYCTWCGYSDSCSCWAEAECCGKAARDCYCNDEDWDLMCKGCSEQLWSCVC